MNRYCGQVSAKTFEPVAARPADRGGAFGGRDMEDHDRLVDQRRARDEPVEGLGLGERADGSTAWNFGAV